VLWNKNIRRTLPFKSTLCSSLEFVEKSCPKCNLVHFIKTNTLFFLWKILNFNKRPKLTFTQYAQSGHHVHHQSYVLFSELGQENLEHFQDSFQGQKLKGTKNAETKLNACYNPGADAVIKKIFFFAKQFGENMCVFAK
jgi:hypothetical protein